MNLNPSRVVVLGQGYVGLPISIGAVTAGFDVVGLEEIGTKVDALKSGQSYITDISDQVLTAALETLRYHPTTDISECTDFDYAIITVPTPLFEGAPDLSYIEKAALQIGPLVRPGATVILESTTYPGTTEELLVPILERESGLTAGPDFHVGYSPERIDPGNPKWNLLNTPKIVSGIDQDSLLAVTELYEQFVSTVVPVSTPKVAELVKLLENTFRHVNIALVNELAMFSADLNVDLWEAIAAATTKPFGYMPFAPGPGVGGHCLPIDPSYLSWKVKRSLGTSFRFVELANDVNDHMPDYVVRRITASLNAQAKSINGSRILILGLSYKRNSSDMRESPGPIICDRLISLGGHVRAVDPNLEANQFPANVELTEVTDEELELADLVVIITDHDAFDWNHIRQKAHHVFDTRHRISSATNVEYL